LKLLFFDDYSLGVLNGDNVVDVSSVVADIPALIPHHTMAGLIEDFDSYRPKLEEAVAARQGVPVSQVRIRPPLPHPSNIVCMAVNYMENGTRAEPAPIDGFHKSPDTIIGNGDTMVLGDVPATVFEGEAELAAVIGRRARNVPASQALDYIFGWTCFIDGSARGLKPGGFYQMKSRTTYAPIGPVIVTKDEISDPQNLHVRLWNNGELMQDYNTNDMAHKIPRCVEFVTAAHTLEPGDILALGTNHRGLHPFQGGDRIEIEVEGIGRLQFNVDDDLKRTWPRETRLSRTEKGLPPVPPQTSGKYAPVSA
jgi:2-keto-4-pentenoate hydratase/2-oxohepta-3-ene-1,7-dioic acid hydratase in catechol pathway